MASLSSSCSTALVFIISCLLAIAASTPAHKVSSSDNRLLNKEETWVVEGKKQNEVFPKDEEFEEIEGPEPTAAKKKRNANGDVASFTSEGPQYAYNVRLSNNLRNKRDDGLDNKEDEVDGSGHGDDNHDHHDRDGHNDQDHDHNDGHDDHDNDHDHHHHNHHHHHHHHHNESESDHDDDDKDHHHHHHHHHHRNESEGDYDDHDRNDEDEHGDYDGHDHDDDSHYYDDDDDENDDQDENDDNDEDDNHDENNDHDVNETNDANKVSKREVNVNSDKVKKASTINSRLMRRHVESKKDKRVKVNDVRKRGPRKTRQIDFVRYYYSQPSTDNRFLFTPYCPQLPTASRVNHIMRRRSQPDDDVSGSNSQISNGGSSGSASATDSGSSRSGEGNGR